MVTGGAGFIGSNLVAALLGEGHDLVVVDNESSTVHDQFYWDDRCENLKLDISNYQDILPYFKGVDFVFHLAAQSRIQPSITNPLETIRVNVLGTANVLEASRVNGVKRVIYSTTSSYYGLKNPTPNVETQPEDCLNPYSVSKVTGDKLCKVYADVYALETVSLRYFCVYGKNEPLKGEFAPVIGLFLKQKKSNSPLTVVGDGSQLRDFTHIDDVISANLLVMTSPLVENGGTYNVGSGKSFSIMEIAALISEEIVHLPPRPAESRETLANSEKIYAHFGWQPKKSLVDYINEQLRA